MMIPKQDMDAALACLTEAFPQTFVLEKHRPHRPLIAFAAVAQSQAIADGL